MIPSFQTGIRVLAAFLVAFCKGGGRLGASVSSLHLDPVSSAALAEEAALSSTRLLFSLPSSLLDCFQGCAEASQFDVI